VDGGRGFIIVNRVSHPFPKLKLKNFRPRPFVEHRVVVTAAHCLPKLPPAHAGSFLSERTWNLLGNLDGSKKDIWAECLLVDPVADIAVLGCPDGHVFEDEPEAYFSLTDDAPVLQIGKARSGSGWVLSLDGHWIRTTLEVFSGPNGIVLKIGPTEPGMSGSPVLGDGGRAVGVVAIGSETVSADGERKQADLSGPQPMLARNLPGWLLQSQ
jgi:hypothetical protein